MKATDSITGTTNEALNSAGLASYPCPISLGAQLRSLCAQLHCSLSEWFCSVFVLRTEKNQSKAKQD